MGHGFSHGLIYGSIYGSIYGLGRRFGRGFDRSFGSDRRLHLVRGRDWTRFGCLRRRRLGHGCFRCRQHGRLGPFFHPVAQRTKDRPKVLAGATDQGRHPDHHGEAARSVEGGRRLDARRAVPPGERRPDDVGQSLEHVDAHGPLAAYPVSGDRIERVVDLLVGSDRCASARRQALERIEPCGGAIPLLERPELEGEHARCRLEQRRDIDVVGAEAHAEFAQCGARRLIEPLDLIGDLAAIEHAQRLDQLECDAAGDAGDLFAGSELEQRSQQLFDMGLEPEV